MLKTPANNELDSLKKLFVGVCQYQHAVMDEKDPVFIIFEDIVHYLRRTKGYVAFEATTMLIHTGLFDGNSR